MLRALVVISLVTPAACVAQLTTPRLIELRLTADRTSVDSAIAFAALRRGLERDGVFRVLEPLRPFERPRENPDFVILANGYRFQGRTFFKITGLDGRRRGIRPESIKVPRDSVAPLLEALGVRLADRLATGVGLYRRPPSD